MKKDNSYRVFCGGCWYNGALSARVANRFRYVPSDRSDDLGFRLSRVVNPLEQLSEVCDEQR